MKIKQAEDLSGITTKNIRFYEEQGLLKPKRNNENRYRDYDDYDIRTLKTIKILRKLDVSMDNIRDVLYGKKTLSDIASQHIEFLQHSIQKLEAAQAICKEFTKQQSSIETLDVDACLDEIYKREKQGATFTNIYEDFKLVAKAIETMRFHFFPDELVTTPEEFTDALLQYAKEQKLNLVITKESMYPEFIINGIEYKAMRYTTRFGSAISVEAENPDNVLPKHISHKRLYIMEWLWRIGFPILVMTIPITIFILGMIN